MKRDDRTEHRDDAGNTGIVCYGGTQVVKNSVVGSGARITIIMPPTRTNDTEGEDE